MSLKSRDFVNRRGKTKGRIILGTHHPRDASSQGRIIKGRIIQGCIVQGLIVSVPKKSTVSLNLAKLHTSYKS
jgi:hypothetical protein